MWIPNETCACAAAGTRSSVESASVFNSVFIALSYAVESGAAVSFGTLPADRVAAADDAEQHGDDRDHEEDVNESSHRVGRGEPEQPEDDEDGDDGDEHGVFLLMTVGGHAFGASRP